MKNNLIRLFSILTVVAISAVSAFAQGQPEAANHNSGLGYLAAVVGFAIAAGLCGLGQGKVAGAACEGLARNPGAFKGVPLPLILGLVFIETLVIFTLVVVLLKVPNPV